MKTGYRFNRRRAMLVAASILTALGLGGGNAAMAADQPLVIARDFDFNSLDPARAWCDSCQIYLTNVYESLIRLAPDNQTLQPGLALSWEGNADQTQYTFHLDPADAVLA